MKILHYCNQFSPLSQTFIYDVIIQLNLLGVNNLVVTNDIINKIERPYSNIYKLSAHKPSLIRRSRWRLLNILNIDKSARNKDILRAKKKQFYKIISEFKPEIIHAHFGPAGYEMAEVANDLKIPLFVSFHGFDAFRLPKESVWMERLKNVFSVSNSIIVVSELMKSHLIALGCDKEKLKVVHVGKRLMDYPYLENVPKSRFNFMSIGRLTEKKGHDDVILAFKSLINKFPRLHLNIVGEGPQKDFLESLITEHKLNDHIRLVGPLSHGLTKKMLMDSDVFILASKTASDGDMEGIPTVLMEAQALGKPCISTHHSGIPEIFSAENKWMLAREADPDDISLKIQELIEKPEDQLLTAIRAGRKKVENEFSLEAEVVKLVELYKTASS